MRLTAVPVHLVNHNTAVRKCYCQILLGRFDIGFAVTFKKCSFKQLVIICRPHRVYWQRRNQTMILGELRVLRELFDQQLVNISPSLPVIDVVLGQCDEVVLPVNIKLELSGDPP